MFEQNNEKPSQSSVRSTVKDTVKVVSYDDIFKAQRKRDIKEAITAGTKTPRRMR